MNLKLLYLRYEFQNGRHIAFVQAFDNATDTFVFSGTLAQTMVWASQSGHNIINAEEILYNVVVLNGFAA